MRIFAEDKRLELYDILCGLRTGRNFEYYTKKTSKNRNEHT